MTLSARLRRGAWLGPLGLLLVVGLVAAVALTRPSVEAPAPASAASVQAYANAVARATAPAGQVVETDMKPSVGSWENGTLAADVFAARAGGWGLTFRRTRAQLAKISIPTGLEGTHAAFLSSLDAYATAADMFRVAAPTPNLSADATAAVRAADARYTEASVALQKALRTAGLSPDVRFPGF
ncbi:MAG: hypothetical protein QOK05_2349 [Chloroflexota bacterium]|jgi:hypothetical protein|nr:hypothetical protein [Chloroflexota bacterium]